MGDACVAAEDQVGQGPAREIGCGDPLARVPTRGGYAPRWIVGHRWHPVAGYGKRPSPSVGEPRAFEGREPVPRGAAQRLVRGPVPIVLVLYARAVIDRVAIGRHALAFLPADPVPPLIGEGLGKHDEGVDGE